MTATALQWARRTAAMYRRELLAMSPERCERADVWAIRNGQRWAVPTEIAATDKEADALLDAMLPASVIAERFPIPANTIRGWASKLSAETGKPLLTKRCAAHRVWTRGCHGKCTPVYVVRDVLMCQARKRKSR